MSTVRYDAFGEAVQRRRRELGLSQSRLADTLGISRQNLLEIEAGRRLPQLPLAHHMARAFGWSLDDLAGHLAPPQMADGIRWVFGEPPATLSPVVWTVMDHQLTVAPAGRVTPEFAMDGIWDPERGTVRESQGASDPSSTLFIAGCDPFLPWLWERTPHPELTLHIFSMGSKPALEALAQGQVHLAGTHLLDEATGRYNRLAETLSFPVARWQYLKWEEGVMGEIARPDGWVLREAGSEARALFERRRPALPEVPLLELDSHWAIARYVRSHPETAGIGLKAVAASLNLPFAPWAEEPYEWVTRQEWTRDTRLKAFQHWLGSPAVGRAIEQIPGLTPWDAGQAVR